MKQLKHNYSMDKSIRAKGDPKVQGTKDLVLYFRTILKLFETQIPVTLSLLNKRIIEMYKVQSKRRNIRQVFTYLKEVYTLNNSILSNGTYIPKMRVAVDKKGRPKLLPIYIREIYLDNRIVFVAVQTVLGAHRLLK